MELIQVYHVVAALERFILPEKFELRETEAKKVPTEWSFSVSDISTDGNIIK